MSWKDLLQQDQKEELIAMPFLGSRTIFNAARTFTIEGDLPPTRGWYAFSVDGSQKCKLYCVLDDLGFDDHGNEYEFNHEGWKKTWGYTVHDRIVTSTGIFKSQLSHIFELFCPTYGYIMPNGDFLALCEYAVTDFVHEDVLEAYLSRKTLEVVKGVNPALHAAFEYAIKLRDFKEEQERILLAKIEEDSRLEEQRRILEEQRESSGTTYSRRQITDLNFELAAKSAVEFGGATFLSCRATRDPVEMAVKFEMEGQRITCKCHKNTLQIIDSGVCLTDERTGTAYDNHLTLETLPPVIKQAKDDGVLVVWSTRASRW